MHLAPQIGTYESLEPGCCEDLAKVGKALAENSGADAAALELGSDPELVHDFLIEAREHLAKVEAGVLALERNPADSESLNGVFRCFHTIKGLAGFLGAGAVHEIAHETENVLGLIRSGGLTFSQQIIDLILRATDELNRCLAGAAPGNLHLLPRCESNLLSALAGIAKENSPATISGPETSVLQKPGQTESLPAAAQEQSAVRIATSKLEYLIDMVGELVIASSVVAQHSSIRLSQDPILARNVTQLVRVLKEVQKTSMSMRMVAISTLFRKMSRLTRDLAQKSGKKIELVTSGDEIELDRNLVEELADPLVHMIRNAVDHGLESTAERRLAGKSETGTVCLRAVHDGGVVVIEIGDDGKGLDAAKILAKGRRLGLVAEHEELDEQAIFHLIFAPGFSTVDRVTDLSGRGVGMDVVRKHIQKLRGRVSINSLPGKGCTFVLRLPLTLAIIDGLVVRVGSQRYILPMFAVREIISTTAGTFVTMENRAEAALVREALLPVVRLSGFGEADSEVTTGGVLIVTESRDQLICIAVDELIGKQEVVIKSLGKTFREIPAVSGGAILGDGRVGLIIDVNSLRCRS